MAKNRLPKNGTRIVAMRKRLPKDGTRVVAYTTPSIEYDRPAQRVEGVLLTRDVPALDYVQCWVDGVQVDEETVRVEEPSPTEPPRRGRPRKAAPEGKPARTKKKK